MGEIHNERDIEMAIGTVAELLREINEKAETDLWENAKIYRVDVTHDVITPSEDYSNEIIRIAKKSLLRCGYYFWQPTKEEGNEQYICCSSYGRPRSRDYHWKYYKKLLSDCGLPDIRWHDLRSTFCTILLKNDFSPKAVSKLMGHAKEIITVDVYGDNQNIIADAVLEINNYMEEVLPCDNAEKESK